MPTFHDGSDAESVSSHSDASSSSSDYSEEDQSFREENFHPNETPQKQTKKKSGRSSNGNATAGSSTMTTSNGGGAGNKKTIEETYQKKTQLEHILLRPDTYIGSTQQDTQTMFVLNAETKRIESKDVTYTPGFYKIFDEIIVNAADNKQRDPNMDRMEVVVDQESNTISVMNNGKGIPVQMHKEHNCYVPTLIFGHLLTGSNFDDDEKKTTGGRNGYGAKLANIFSTKFVIECLDSEQGLKFTQTFRNNMHTAEDPIVKKCTSVEKKKGDYTKITFRPDLKKFGMETLDDDAVSLISKRAYDIAGSMAMKGGKKLSVYLNGEKVPVKDFKSYLALFDGIESPTAYESMDNFEVGVAVSPDLTFKQVSFVNAIATTKGGGHVNFIVDKIAKHLQPIAKKKNKGGANITPAQIKNHLSVFVNCLVENPTFDSQTKENLTTKHSAIAKSVKLSEEFLKQVEKSGIVDQVLNHAKFKQSEALKRKGGKKKTKLTGITKLDDANFAGTAKAKDCTLIITEGDSAKSLAMSGLSVVGRDYYGVFPLKGKPLNVRDATHAQVMKNDEIMNLVQIMGLKFGATYDESNVKSLRYGHLMIMADQDHDGSHIKGLVINFIHHFWPTLLDVPGFLQQFITPIVKCTKGKKFETFFTLPEYEAWKESTGNNAKGWTTKYYKGLGTSTSAEAKEYFSNLNIHEIHFNTISDDVIDEDEDDEDRMSNNDAITTGAGFIDMAFSKRKVNERKKWLSNVDKDTYLNYSEAQKNGINYSDFINRELVLFSNYDNARSIPHVMDGLKPSQRKVLYACFKKKLKNEIKVAQLAGYIGEHSAYHHGEMSLTGAIINMAQSYVGSNNVNLLYPSGQFGTRRMGGKDHASARYIFTRLENITRAIFHPDDDALLNYLSDDGLSIEPEYYMPVIPLVLVNGSDGIGTGWSSTVQNHDPREVIANLRKMIHGEEPEIMHPAFYGFTGEIIAETGRRGGSYIVRGKIKRTNDTTLEISELPIGKWTQDYKAFLEKMMDADKVDKADKSESEISDFKEHHTESTVKFVLTATKEKIDEFEKGKDGLIGKFKLSSHLSSKNMTLFDKNSKIHRYETTLDVLQTFFQHRLEFYAKRKDMLLSKLKQELKILANKERFIKEVCDGDLVVRNRKRAELLAELSEREYDLCPKDEKKEESDEEEGDDDSVDESATDAELAKGYEYLLGMKIWSLTFERAEELRRQRADKSNEAEVLEATSPQSIWLTDLDAIDEALLERNKTLALDMKKATSLKKRAVKQTKAVAKKAAMSTKKTDEWDSDLVPSDSEDEPSADEDDDSFNNDDFIQKEESPKKKQKTSATKSSRLSSSGKQKVVLATRTERKSLDVSRKQSSSKKAVSKKEHPKEIPEKKKTVRRRKKKSSILKEALDAQVELGSDAEDKMPVKELNIKMKAKPMEVDDLIDSEDESPKKKPAPAFKADAFEEDCSVSEEESPQKMPKKVKASLSKKKSQQKPKKKSICHLSSDEESEGYESEMSVDKRTPASKRGRKKLSKPKRSMFEEESDEDDFMF